MANGLARGSRLDRSADGGSGSLRGVAPGFAILLLGVAVPAGIGVDLLVGQSSFVVEHLVSQAERWIVDTEPREQ